MFSPLFAARELKPRHRRAKLSPAVAAGCGPQPGVVAFCDITEGQWPEQGVLDTGKWKKLKNGVFPFVGSVINYWGAFDLKLFLTINESSPLLLEKTSELVRCCVEEL